MGRGRAPQRVQSALEIITVILPLSVTLVESARLGEVIVNDAKEQGAKMNKSELKTGMVITYRGGDTAIVALGHYERGDSFMDSCVSEFTGFMDFDSYTDDLRCIADKKYDVVEIHQGSYDRAEARILATRIYLRNETTYKELTPHEAMIKLMDDGEFECQLKDHSKWITAKLTGVKPQKTCPFLSMDDNHFYKCRIKEEA